MKTFNQFILENRYVFDNKTPIQYAQVKKQGENTFQIKGYNTRIIFNNASLATDRTSVVNSKLQIWLNDGMQLTKQDSLEKVFQTVAYMFANYIKVSSENPNRIVGKIEVVDHSTKLKTYNREVQSYLEKHLLIVKKTGRALGFDFKYDNQMKGYQIDPWHEKEREKEKKPIAWKKQPRKVIRAAKRFRNK